MGGKVRIGVIGAGIGSAHSKALKQVKDAELSAICDIDEARAKVAATNWQIPKVYKDYKEMIKKEKLDAVTVALPNHLHKEVTIKAFEMGCHVFCEKPMAMNAGEAEEMIAAGKKAKKILAIGFVQRFRSESLLLKKLITGGDMGNVYHSMVFALRRRGVPGWGTWFTTKSKSGGGGLIDIGVHIIDLTMWEMGFPKPVSVTGSEYMMFGHKKDYNYISMWGSKNEKGIYDVDDYATAFVRFENGATMTLEVSWAANVEKDCFYSVILGDKGGARLDIDEPLKIYTEHYGKIADIVPKYIKEDNWFNQFSNFIDSVKNNKTPVTPGEHGLQVQKVIDAIYLSSKTKKEDKIT